MNNGMKVGIAVLIIVILLVVLYYSGVKLPFIEKRQNNRVGMQGQMRDTRGWDISSRAFGVPITVASLAPVVREGRHIVQVSNPAGVDLAPWRTDRGPNVPLSSSGAREGLHAGN